MTKNRSKRKCRSVTRSGKSCTRQALEGHAYCWQHFSKSWRKFEKLVATLEHWLAPIGATVKSPDRIRDLVTGRSREVDASIRFQAGLKPILITVECRERNKIQDDTWIEQLAYKKEKIGATATIAVSTKGFSKSAIKSAQYFDIKLRRVLDITGQDIARQWLEDITIDAEYLSYFPVSFVVRFDIGDAFGGAQLSSALEDQIRRDPFNTGIIFEKNTDRPITVKEIIDNHDIGAGVEVDTPSVRKTFWWQFRPSTYYSLTNSGSADVLGMEFIIEIERGIVRIPLAQIFEYNDLSQPLMQMAEASIPVDGKRSIAVQLGKKTDNTALTTTSL